MSRRATMAPVPLPLSTAIERYRQALIAQGRSKSTYHGYWLDLRPLVVCASRDTVDAFTFAAVQTYFTIQKGRGLGPATLSRKWAALVGFAEYGLQQSWWRENPMRHWPAPRVPPREPKPFTDDERDRLMRLELPPQERIVRALLYYTGMRVTPLCQVRRGDLDFSPGVIKGIPYAGSIRTVQKGGRTLRYLMDPQLKGLLEDWVSKHPAPDSGPLLTTPRGGPYHREGIERMVQRWGQMAGVKGVTPHRFRHTYATDLLRGGVDVRVVQVMMGHASINTTMAYTKVSDDQVARAVGVLKRYDGETS